MRKTLIAQAIDGLSCLCTIIPVWSTANSKRLARHITSVNGAHAGFRIQLILMHITRLLALTRELTRVTGEAS